VLVIFIILVVVALFLLWRQNFQPRRRHPNQCNYSKVLERRTSCANSKIRKARLATSFFG
jgi:hypothetical protein